MSLSLGERLKLAREYHTPKVTQVKLSQMIGIDRTVLAKYETQRADKVPYHVLLAAAKALGVREEYFTDDVNEPPLRYRINVPGMGMGISPMGGDPPAPSNYRGPQPGVGRRVFPVLGSAGASTFPLSPGDDPEDWVEFSDELYDRHRDQFAIRVWGDSAEPDMRHGDFVLVVKDPGFRLSGFFVVAKSPDQGFVVKECAGGEGAIELRSVNSKFEPVKVGDGWEMIGYAIGWRRDRGLGVYLEAGDKTGLRPGFRE
jgi:SOS-response transcriptional repressor LexA